MATAAARVLAATAIAVAAEGQLLSTATPTPLPYNAVIGVYVYATAAPENLATAVAADQARAEAVLVNGTPTPLPWNAIIITAVPDAHHTDRHAPAALCPGRKFHCHAHPHGDRHAAR